MKVVYAGNAEEDRHYWKKNSPKILEKIDALIADIKLHPFTGLGKPEALKFQYSGYWSRRINHEHRLVYKVHHDIIYIVQCRLHY
jgi:toxin YoeB